MVRRMMAVAAVVAIAGAAGLSTVTACGGATVPKIDCTKATPKKWSDLTILKKCTSCHESKRMTVGTANDQPDGSRHGATAKYDYDTYDGTKLVASQAQDDIAGSPPGLHLMPPTNDAQWHEDAGAKPQAATEAEKTDFYTWFQCGTPN